MTALAKTPLVLVIIDGWGIAPPGPGNAITQSRTPVMDDLQRRFPSTTLAASGRAVGLPQNQEGNSEAGHMNLGAGRVVEQDSVRISKSINDGSFFKNAAFLAAVHHVRKYQSQLHLMGLLTEAQSGHADPDHLLALLTFARQKEVPSIVLHLFTDGRDSPPQAAVHLVRSLESMLPPTASIGTIIGRFYAMDRKKYWPRIRQTYNALVLGQGRQAATAEQAILEAYEREQTDEFIAPTIIGARTKCRIRSNDSVLYFNLRSDRARELTKAFVQPDFSQKNPGAFRRTKVPRNLLFVAMTDFGPDLGEMYTAYPSVDIYNSLPVVLRKYRQLYIAESEKYAHVTYFFNGGYDKPVAGEDRALVPSPDVSSYDATPDMSAPAITAKVLEDIQRHAHDVIVMNYANADMVGHTGNLRATVQAVEAVDTCIGQIREAVLRQGGTLIVTADHGNAEQKVAADGKAIATEHTTNPVPLIIVTSKPLAVRLQGGGKLADVAPTVLRLLGVEQPLAMSGHSLIV